MHNGFINVDNEKMSKSKGNFFTVRDIAKEFDLEAVRYVHAVGALPQPAELQPRADRAEPRAALERLYTARDQLRVPPFQGANVDREPNEAEQKPSWTACTAIRRSSSSPPWTTDLNTADALSSIFELVREIFKLDASDVSRKAVEFGKETFLGMTDVLGLLMKKDDGIDPEVQKLVDERAEARKNKDWKRSDELRDQIKAMGYILEDTAAGQKVRKSGV